MKNYKPQPGMTVLKCAPKFSYFDMQTAIDNLVNYSIKDEKKRIYARIYFYRTRLGMDQERVAAIFKMDPYFINIIAMKTFKQMSTEIYRLEQNFKYHYPKYLKKRYSDHLVTIQKRLGYDI